MEVLGGWKRAPPWLAYGGEPQGAARLWPPRAVRAVRVEADRGSTGGA
jgi:hypothetical protein